MNKKNPILMGTLILTIAGFLTRILGLFYRVFLSRTIGSEGMGIYQLIFPIYAFCFSLCSAGIQTSVSRFVAAKSTNSAKKESVKILIAGLFISLALSIFTAVFIYMYADFISTSILKEAKCAPLLRYLAFSLPLGSIHACISGYYLGYKRASVPAWSQLIEQIIRVSCVYIIGLVLTSNGGKLTPELAVLGTVIGELGSALYCIFAIKIDTLKKELYYGDKDSEKSTIPTYIRKILSMSIPLTLNRVMLNVLQSAEAILIPFKLQAFGLTSSEALSKYGILTGMAMPFIFFPSAITNSIAVMLLPAVAEAQYKGDKGISSTTDKSLKYSIIIGIFCIGLFLVYGNDMGTLIFDNKEAGLYIMILAWLCPFLYITTTLGSILNGLGRTTTTFFHNMIAVLIRIAFLLYCVPKVGIMGYLWGVLVGQLVISFLHTLAVKREIHIKFNAVHWILIPVFYLLASLSLGYLLKLFLTYLDILPGLINVFISGVVVTGMFWILVQKTEKQKIFGK